MDVLILGAGLMGSVLARDMARQEQVEKVTLLDADEEKLQKLREGSFSKLESLAADINDRDRIINLMKAHTVTINAMPERWSILVTKMAIEAGANLVDLTSSDTEKRLALHDTAREAGCTILTGCGLAPGLTNILAGRAVSRMDSTEKLIARVGGIPRYPQPPLNYSIVFSFESVIEDCTTDAIALRDHQIVRLPALSEVDQVHFEGLGSLESFVTNGLGTLPYVMAKKGVSSIVEKTLRYPGFADKMMTLRDLGLFEEREIFLKKGTASPKEMVTCVLTEKLQKEEDHDLVVFRLTAKGILDGKKMECQFEMMDAYDEVENVSAMARTTAYPTNIIARMVAQEVIKEKGVLPLETSVGENEAVFRRMMEELKSYGIIIKENTYESD